MRVPFLDLNAHHAPHMGEFEAAIRSVITSGAFAGGPFVAGFEEDFAAYCQCKEALGVGSGTEALWLALLASGVGPGDEVITVPSTFMATAEAITYCGARPVFVDIEEQTYTMDPSLLEAAITPRTKAVIPVHLFGQTADMDPIIAIAKKHGLVVIEDACQAHGAEYKGRRAGSLTAAGCFSFYPGKNLGAFGEAGAIVTNDAELADKMRILRDHGQVKKYYHSMVGWNCRMDGIQGAVLRIKLRHLEKANEARRAHAASYCELLRDVEDIILPVEAKYARHVFHVFAIRHSERDELMKALNADGIGCGIHYPVPVHLQECYKSLGYTVGDFPIAEKAASEFVSLPMYPELTQGQIEEVVRSVKNAVAGRVPA
ncbi:MAG TPA: DegT/DnrJ/EryC1/StrS family aminotransferase [Verrucomicrobiales bacterium]|nr:DegT/DnrJ/EryC1/StrS family aminotransferase [Verrucomicrobiales bacterium]